MSKICSVCKQPLDKSLYNDDETFKSCPLCSQKEGVHIFYPYPDCFGTTYTRSSKTHPEGPQSQCVNCRSREEANTSIGKRYDQI